MNEYLRIRYGVRETSRPGWLIPAIVLGIVGGGWILWTANHHSTPQIRSTLISFEEVSDSQISIRYSLELKDPSIAHTCLLTAKDYGVNVVGQLTDLIPTGQAKVTREVLIPTRLRAVNAGIEKCF
ncbi:unannotated protein [freshwater metagenome]|uniref:Unannotated protein n=1 Tax=freshwater metagenome TaxID=449393 RepID=A0A6J6H1Q6_9ZZZZ|nr:DUF4307 domain-containing protein [Actinomycetota bacterium]MSW15119.1 DUF4307 domain-containing protein [Actinomycetota bacterium]MSW98718.1 DUF4307 domain-containing protein [Actinomycetota bacterium]MSY82458.1 DUF4307 domain-containing protein [Actinomycetota bacterium]MSZ45436.1 DUF4307 domain-containing protein [Actinomycetota bacterium]